MALTEAQIRATKNYHQKLDEMKLRVPKGERKVIQDHAASRSESLNAFLYRSVKETMKRDMEK